MTLDLTQPPSNLARPIHVLSDFNNSLRHLWRREMLTLNVHVWLRLQVQTEERGERRGSWGELVRKTLLSIPCSSSSSFSSRVNSNATSSKKPCEVDPPRLCSFAFLLSTH